METAPFILMISVQLLVTLVTVYFFVKVLKTPVKE